MNKLSHIAPDSKEVGIWIRVSTEDQARGESPEHHEHRARAYAEFKGWKVKEVYHLEGVSGKLVLEHPEAKRMLADIREGKITALIFSKLARLARNTTELLKCAEIFRECSADLVSLQEAIDTSTPAGRLFYTMLAAMAQWEREEITERVIASVPIRAKLGKPLGGSAPYGYQWKERKLVIHPDEAPVRKLMYELFLRLHRKKAVANELNKTGYRTRNGSLFCAATVGRLIPDSTAKGIHRGNCTRRTGDGTRWVLKPESEWVYNSVEPIVAEDVWEECNRLIGGDGKPKNRLAKRTVHLFSGLAVCGCGAKMYVPTNSSKYVCGSCKRKIPITDLEDIFFEQLQNFLLSPTEITALLGKANDTLADKEQLLQSRNKEWEKNRLGIDRTHKLYMEEQLTAAAFGKLYKPLEDRQKQIEEEIPRLQAEVDFLKVNAFSSDQVLNDAHDLQARWPNLSGEEKRTIVECIVDRVVIDEEISIDLVYFPSSKEITKREWSLGDSNP